jgi:hypothetical protein
LVDDIGNLTLLTYGSNQKLSDELPENHLRRVLSEIFKAHHIPENRELWNLEKMEEFIKMHKEKLKEAVEKSLSNV